MATDYDAPRRNETDDMAEDSLDELKARRNEAQSSVVDVDETDTAESFELPGADLSGEELTVKVLPKQADEFTCASCFLVHHRSRLAEPTARSTSAATARPEVRTPEHRSTPRQRGRDAGRGGLPVAHAEYPVGRRVVRVGDLDPDDAADPAPDAS